MSVCPRCPESPLVPSAGVLHEAVCPSCQGRFLDEPAARQVIEDELGVTAAMLKELTALFGGISLSCPSCGLGTRPVTLRGVPVDVCFGCGGLWCDAGELERLSSGKHREVRVEPPADPSATDGLADAARGLLTAAATGERRAQDASLEAGGRSVAPATGRRLRKGGSALFLEHPGPIDDEVLWQALGPFAQYSRQDMPLLARRSGGILLEGAHREDAETVGTSLRAAGLAAHVDDSRWTTPVHPHQLRRLDVSDRGVRFTDMHERPWEVGYDELLALNVGFVSKRVPQPRHAMPEPVRMGTHMGQFQGSNLAGSAIGIYKALRSVMPAERSQLVFDVIADGGRVQVSDGSQVTFDDAHQLGPDRLLDAMARVLSHVSEGARPVVFGLGFEALDAGEPPPAYPQAKHFDREAAWARWWAYRRAALA